MKAIETHYREIRFRSRLEARWAVFFDAMRLEWLYEHQGYVIDERAYLPDFFLPRFGIHFEVKGGAAAAKAEEELFYRFVEEVSPILVVPGPPVLVQPGPEQPWDGAGTLYCGDRTDSSGGQSEFLAFIGADEDHDPTLVAQTHREDRILCFRDWTPIPHHHGVDERWPETPDFFLFAPFEDAVIAARSARFEHGERP